MNCQEFEKLCAEIVGHGPDIEDIDPELQMRFDQHYNECPRCRATFDAAFKADALLRTAPEKIFSIQDIADRIEIYVSGKKQRASLQEDQMVIPIKRPSDVVIKFPGKKEWAHKTTRDEIYTSLKAASARQKKEPDQTHDLGQFQIEIRKGDDEGRLIIKIKE